MKIYEIKQPEEVQKQACLLSEFQVAHFVTDQKNIFP